MYLHLGQETVIDTGELVGLFDLDTTTLGKKTREFLAAAEKAGQVVNVSAELPKSFVLTADSRVRANAVGQRVYISQLSAGTLKRRINIGYDAGIT